MIFQFTGLSRLTLESAENIKTYIKSVEVQLVHNNADSQPTPFEIEGIPTIYGYKILSQTFIHGIIANIKGSHEAGYWNEVEHIKWVIDELGRAFANPTNPTQERDFDENTLK